MKPGILQEQIVVLQGDCADFGLAPPELQIAEVEDDLNKQQAGCLLCDAVLEYRHCVRTFMQETHPWQ